jgi:cephalosporin hydroxylase
MMRVTGQPAYVISVDPYPHRPLPVDDDVVFLTGSSTDPWIWKEIARIENLDLAPGAQVLVNLDADHSYEHVTAELDIYSKFVTSGSYLIVEDGVDDFRDGREGVYAATRDWLADHPEFEVDRFRERLGLTNCPGGFLRRT